MSFTEARDSDRLLKWMKEWIAPHVQSFADENCVRHYWAYQWFVPTNVKHLHKFVSNLASSRQCGVSDRREKELEDGFMDICETLGTMRFCQFCISMDVEGVGQSRYQVDSAHWIQYHYNCFLNEVGILRNRSNNYFKKLERSSKQLLYAPLEKDARTARESLEKILAEFQIERNQHTHERRAKRSALTTAGLSRYLKPGLRSPEAARFAERCRELLGMDQKLILWKTGMACFQYEMKLATSIACLRISATRLSRDLGRIEDKNLRDYFLRSLAKQ
jgi:hypothetical protein